MLHRAPGILLLVGTIGFVGCSDLIAPSMASDDGSSDDALSGAVESGASLITTANVNFRSAPSMTASVLRVLRKGTIVKSIGTQPTGVFYNVRAGGDDGWVHGAYLAPASTGGGDGAAASAPCAAPRPDGACRIYAASGRRSAQNPAYSPDGSRILFTIWQGGYNAAPATLATIGATGGTATTIVDNGASNVNLPGTSWNRIVNRITYSSDVTDGPDEIFTSDPDGGHATRVTRHSGSAVYIEPSFSPDGTQIVFEVDTSDSAAEIWKVNADGSGLTRLTQGSNDRQPNWSPVDGTILFQRQTSDWALYTMDSNGGGVRRITPVADSSTDASWSPDGTRIVYSSSRGELAGANLFIVSATGGAPVRVTHHAGYDGAVSWSPDGQWLAFESSNNPDGESATGLWRIHVP